jgi:regulator of sigma E protease
MAGLFMVGKEEPGTRLRAMRRDPAAYQAGLRGGDAVTAVNGKPVASWSDLRWELVQRRDRQARSRTELRGAGGGSYRAVLPAATHGALDPKAT